MSRKLVLVAVSGLVLGVVLLGAAALVAGPELSKHDWNFGDWGGESCRSHLTERRGTRSLAWTGGDHVAINVPANVRYRRGEGEQVVIEGDEGLLPRVRVEDGRIRLDCRLRGGGERLTITLPGREFRSYALHGSGTLTLEDLDQPTLEVRIAGSGDVTASGRTERLEFDVAGSGEGRFANLDTGNVDIRIAGSGDAEVAPRDRLGVDIAGSGKVALTREPARIDTRIAGSGRIIHPDGSVTRASGFSRRSSDEDRNR